MDRIIKLTQQVIYIYKKRHFTARQRLSLALAYIVIIIKRKAIDRGFAKFFDYKNQKFLGFEVELDEYRRDFYWIFLEIFVSEGYYFESKEKCPLIIDCGGNVGMSILYFKTLYPHSKIITFEPSPDNIEILKKNLQKNNIKDVQIVEAALGRKKGELEIFTQGTGTTMYEEFAKKQKQIDKPGFGEKAHVKVHVLSDYIDGRVDFLKLDVEGAEGEILGELDRTGKIKYIKQIAMEYHMFSSHTNKLSDIVDIFERNNYEFLCVTEANNLYSLQKSNYRAFMIFARKM